MSNIQFVFAIIKNIKGQPQLAESIKGGHLISEPEYYIEALLERTKFYLGGKETYTTDEFNIAFRKAFDSWSIEFKKQTVYMK